MAFFRIKYLYKVLLLIIFSMTAYFITNIYLVQFPRTLPYVRRSVPLDEAVSNGGSKYKYSVVVSSSSVRNSSSRSWSSVRKSNNKDPNEFIRSGIHPEAHRAESQRKENNRAHQPSDWFQAFKDQAAKVFHLLAPSSLSEYRKWAIGKQRDFLAMEMRAYQLLESDKHKTWDDLFLEKGGEPIRNIVFTTWRSGSTFLGDLLNAHPGTFYHYEPLLPLEIVQVRSGTLAGKALSILHDVLNCKYSDEYVSYGEEHWWFHKHNTRLAQFCELNHEVCFNADFIASMCRLFPFQSLKTVRMRLKLAKSLLDDPKLNVRLLYFVRDPRGTMQSRHHRDWCPGVPDCDSPRVLCSDLEDDFYAAQSLRRTYPGRFLVLRYEDFSMNINSAVEKLLNFFRLRFVPEVQDFIDNHTQTTIEGLYSITRNSRTTPFRWRTDFKGNFSEVLDIQSQCTSAMSLWGYKMANNMSHMLNFHPVGPAPWPEMQVSESNDVFDLNSNHDNDHIDGRPPVVLNE